jgi:uncharacterized protein
MEKDNTIEKSPAPSKLFTRRRMLTGMAACAVAVYTDMRFIEPNWLGVGKHQVPILPRGAAPIRILQLSDLHVSHEVPLDFIDAAVDLGLKQNPDIVCLTGDFITKQWNEWNAYSRILARLSKSIPTYASTGNHDGGPMMGSRGGLRTPNYVIGMLEKADIPVLMNQRQEIALPGKVPFELLGFGDLWEDDFQPRGLFEKNHARPVRVLMSHNPDTKDLIADSEWELMLSGHTHGGQLILPWGSSPMAPVVDKRFVRGLHHWNNHWLHITKGVGSIWNLRLNCHPEISLIELTSTV